MIQTQDYFSTSVFDKQDPTDDARFYAQPRMVAHIDDSAIEYLRHNIYAQVLPANGQWLDLMSSRYSHLPDDPQPAAVHATGMNRAELAANPALNDYIVHNLNQDPNLPFETDTFDAAMCCVSVQYLQHPLEVFSEVRRVLASGSPFIVSFSNRCFPTKAVHIWLQSSEHKRQDLVYQYMKLTGFHNVELHQKRGGFLQGDPLSVLIGYA